MDQTTGKKGMDELEIIDADHKKVSAMLSALPRAEAPANFEFRVKAGIAKGSPSQFAFLPLLKTAAPLALILVALMFGIFYYERPSDQINNVALSGPPAPAAAPSEPAPAPSLPAAVIPRVSEPVQAERAVVEPNRISERRRVSVPQNRSQGGSVDRIIHQANVIMPPGFESANPQNRNANTAAPSTTGTPVRDVLGMFGIDGDFGDGGWRVRSVKENSFGSRTKIAAGDVIESIDGQSVKSETRLKSGAKTFTVRRAGNLITLPVGN